MIDSYPLTYSSNSTEILYKLLFSEENQTTAPTQILEKEFLILGRIYKINKEYIAKVLVQERFKKDELNKELYSIMYFDEIIYHKVTVKK
jgi:hypothetical protein